MLQEINRDAAEAFMADKPFRRKNTEVYVNDHTTVLILCGHDIAIRLQDSGRMWVSLAGWPTVITRARLSALPGVRINQRCGEQFINDKPMPVWGWVEV